MNVKNKSRNGRSGGHPPLEAAQLQAVAELFGVLSEGSRLRILQILQAGPLSVGELVEQSRLKQANVSKQLGILQSAGIIDRRQDGNRAIYSIKLPLVFELCELVCHGVAKQAAERAAALARNA
ncbi:MAG TPA: metalloregulator ArsR/SmtB family transcription factor [Tepidisphaeraceae bacterium]|jgi:DNA-binding transcriptional ArsR family regulator